MITCDYSSDDLFSLPIFGWERKPQHKWIPNTEPVSWRFCSKITNNWVARSLTMRCASSMRRFRRSKNMASSARYPSWYAARNSNGVQSTTTTHSKETCFKLHYRKKLKHRFESRWLWCARKEWVWRRLLLLCSSNLKMYIKRICMQLLVKK